MILELVSAKNKSYIRVFQFSLEPSSSEDSSEEENSIRSFSGAKASKNDLVSSGSKIDSSQSCEEETSEKAFLLLLLLLLLRLLLLLLF